MKKINKHDIMIFFLGGIIFSCISVSAGAVLLSKSISYSNSNSSVTNVGDALDELYEKAKCSFDVGYTFDFDYTGSEQKFGLPCVGYYKLEAWGAQGGTQSSNVGGYGGYSVGVLDVSSRKTLYINVGGYPSTFTGGYNGGGNGGSSSQSGYGGGGATHISTQSGLLSTLGNNVSSIFIVAGAGGGSGTYDNSKGGSGGGYVGNTGTEWSAYSGLYGTGGTQTSGGTTHNGTTTILTTGSFGLGGNFTETFGGCGGGGGFYGGGGSSRGHAGAGGGSGYISNSSLISSSTITKHMTCYNCQTSTDASTMTNTTTNVSSTATADYAKSGNGYAKITYLGTTLN